MAMEPVPEEPTPKQQSKLRKKKKKLVVRNQTDLNLGSNFEDMV